jgi:hypothetical protein
MLKNFLINSDKLWFGEENKWIEGGGYGIDTVCTKHKSSASIFKRKIHQLLTLRIPLKSIYATRGK